MLQNMKAQDYLKTTRKKLGYTLAGLAQATGYAAHSIKNYEYGMAKVPGDLVLQLQAMEIATENARQKHPEIGK